MSTEYTYSHEAPTGKEAPERVVSLVPSMTETLFDIGVGEHVVGVTDFCRYPEGPVAEKERVGGTKTPNLRKILKLKPDLVIANQEENRKEDIDKLIERGIKVWVTYPRSVRAAMNLIWDTLHVFHIEDRMMYERINLIERQVDWIGGISEAEEDEVCKVFVAVWKDPLMTANADTYISNLVKVCGGTNVFAEKTERYPRVTLDEVTAAKPEVILLPAGDHGFEDDDLQTFDALDVPASDNAHIYLVDETVLSWHGTRISKALSLLPDVMCHES